MTWKPIYRPGFFGRRRDQIVAKLNEEYGKGNWSLVWTAQDFPAMEFEQACKHHYETSYLLWFMEHPEELDFVCSFGECIDNAPTNVQSGCDYTKQEAFSTHIQDIAVRNTLRVLGREFEGPKDKILVIRSADSEGFKYGPGNIPYFDKTLIQSPSMVPYWAKPGSVEDFWQSNKYVAVKE